MKTSILSAILLLLFLCGCHDVPEYKNSPLGNFEALVNIVDTRYCFLDEKKEEFGLDWSAITTEYRSKVRADMSAVELFDLCSEMLATLKDGHTNLIAPFDISYYRNWWSDYPQDFNLRTLEQYYLHFDYRVSSGIIFQAFDVDGSCHVGYMYYPSFSSVIGEGNLDYIMAYFAAAECEALIIDIRDNGGGLLSNVGTLVGRFITEETRGGYILHKTGPGHSDFSSPYEFTYSPAETGRICWPLEKPVYILTNRSCYSAANNFVGVMRSLPNVEIIGARTGGGGGMPFSQELPNGWSVRFSACPILSPEGENTEFGIDPTPGCELTASAEDLAKGHDAILDFAFRRAKLAVFKP